MIAELSARPHLVRRNRDGTLTFEPLTVVKVGLTDAALPYSRRDMAIVERFKAGEPIRRIAASNGISESRVIQILTNHGVTRRAA